MGTSDEPQDGVTTEAEAADLESNEAVDPASDVPEEVGSVVDEFDVIPDDVAAIGELDDAAIAYLDELPPEMIAVVAHEVGAEAESPEAIARAVTDKLPTEENAARLAEFLDSLIPLPPPLEQIDGPVFHYVAYRILSAVTDQIKEAQR